MATILYYTGILYFLNRILRRRYTIILSFHRIVEDSNQAKLTPTLPYLTLPNFERLVKYLREKYTLLSLGEWILRGKKSGGVILTFDDGWKDNYTHAFPVLRKYNAPATIYLAVGLVGTPDVFWQVRLFSLLKSVSPERIETLADEKIRKRLNEVLQKHIDSESFRGLVNFLKTWSNQKIQELLAAIAEGESGARENFSLNWDEVMTMHKAGVGFGSHTLSHPILTREDKLTVKSELELSKQILERHLGEPVNHFAYPEGAYDRTIKTMVQQAGYKTAVTTKEEVNTKVADPYQLSRIEIEENKLTNSKGEFSKELYELETSWLYLKIRNWLKSRKIYP